MEKSIIARHTGGGGNEPQGREGFLSKIPFFKFFSSSKFSVSNVNKYYVGVKPQPTLNCIGRIWKRSIKDSPCHPELVSGSCHRQKCSAICTQKSVSGKEVLDKVGWAFSPTLKYCCGRNPNLQKAISYVSRKATRHVKGDLVPAFTLAEVLITLGIIGIVAAMTLPTLIQNYQKKQTVSQLKKVYSLLNQSVKLAETKHGDSTYWNYDTDARTFYETYLKDELKVIKEGDFADLNLTYHNYDGTSATGVINTMQNRFYYVILVDGTLVAFYTLGTNKSVLTYIDLNGTKPPNQTSRDCFALSIQPVYGVQPYGFGAAYSHVDEDTGELISESWGQTFDRAVLEEKCSKKNKISNSGACLALIILNSWEMGTDYPW